MRIASLAAMSTAILLFANAADAQQKGAGLGETAEAIEKLVDQLASANQPPSRTPGRQELKRPSTWSEEAQTAVQQARAELAVRGKAAFPALLKHLSDERYSMTVAFAEETNWSVGDVCRHIIESQVDVVGMRYKSRGGADGKSHMCPLYFAKQYKYDLDKWWRENREKSLRDMQRDAVCWRIAREVQIGFPNAEERDLYLPELVEILNALDAAE